MMAQCSGQWELAVKRRFIDMVDASADVFRSTNRILHFFSSDLGAHSALKTAYPSRASVQFASGMIGAEMTRSVASGGYQARA